MSADTYTSGNTLLHIRIYAVYIRLTPNFPKCLTTLLTNSSRTAGFTQTLAQLRVGHECLFALCLDLLEVPAILPEDLSAHCASRRPTQDRILFFLFRYSSSSSLRLPMSMPAFFSARGRHKHNSATARLASYSDSN